MISPTKYTPLSPAEFVGEAAQYAVVLQGVVRDATANGNEALKILLNGPPGVGKSSLVRYLAHLLKCDQWSITKMNGTQLKLETVDELTTSMHYCSLTGDYKLIWIDEIDAIQRNIPAQMRFLTMLDDLPDGCAIACTSNCKLSEFEPRFQSRFQTYEIGSAKPEEIATLLKRWPIPADDIAHIAKISNGNVRQALLDARTALNAVA